MGGEGERGRKRERERERETRHHLSVGFTKNIGMTPMFEGDSGSLWWRLRTVMGKEDSQQNTAS